jgi:hypothetical protein
MAVSRSMQAGPETRTRHSPAPHRSGRTSRDTRRRSLRRAPMFLFLNLGSSSPSGLMQHKSQPPPRPGSCRSRTRARGVRPEGPRRTACESSIWVNKQRGLAASSEAVGGLLYAGEMIFRTLLAGAVFTAALATCGGGEPAPSSFPYSKIIPPTPCTNEDCEVGLWSPKGGPPSLAVVRDRHRIFA